MDPWCRLVTNREDAMKGLLLIGAAVALLMFLGRRALRYADPDVTAYGQPQP